MTEEPPTYMMLRTFIESAGLATDTTTLEELGLSFAHEGQA